MIILKIDCFNTLFLEVIILIYIIQVYKWYNKYYYIHFNIEL